MKRTAYFLALALIIFSCSKTSNIEDKDSESLTNNKDLTPTVKA